MTRKTQRIVYGLFVLGICIAFSAAMSFATWGCAPTPTEDNPSTEVKKPVEDYYWRTTTINGCLYIVPYVGTNAITHAGNCPNHDTTHKELQK
jgi:hypothetical protein